MELVTPVRDLQFYDQALCLAVTLRLVLGRYAIRYSTGFLAQISLGLNSPLHANTRTVLSKRSRQSPSKFIPTNHHQHHRIRLYKTSSAETA
jgi:hypothetical protein